MLDFLKRNKNPKLNGWVPDPANKKYLKFNRKDFNLTASNIQYQSGNEVDLRPYSSPIQDQGSTNSCVACSTIKALEIKRIIKHGHANHVDLSIADLYYGARERMTPPMTSWDNGTHIVLACDVLRDLGICRDVMHPFTRENIYKKPPVMASREARLNRITSHFKIKNYGQELLDDILFNLKAGNPVVFGTVVGKDWMNYKGGKEPLGVERYPEGRHAICCVGFVDGKFIIENSWGKNWGDRGFGYLAPEVMTHPGSQDFWVVVDGSEAWTEKK